MVVQGELPPKKNQRGGPGWWMDVDGSWKSPQDWPEDYPPLAGWIRRRDGRWAPPIGVETGEMGETDEHVAAPPNPAVEPTDDHAKRVSRQAKADQRAMYTVAGIIGGAMLLVAGALIVITQAGAADTNEPASEVPEVIFAVETDADRTRRQVEAAATAPDLARERLDQLVLRDAAQPGTSEGTGFDEQQWVPTAEGCLDRTEQVLIERSSTPVTWADQLECVPDRGMWVDHFLGTRIARVIDAEVVELVPPSIVFESGGATWSPATRNAYLSDLRHPATLQVVAAGAGHNPRAQDPSQWRPGAQAVWCAYAVDWIAVKTHWSLDVHAAERVALAEMLDTCALPTSSGANPATVTVDALAPPSIERDSGQS